MMMALCLLPAVLLGLASSAPAHIQRRVLLYVDPSGPSEGAESATVISAAAELGVECVQLWSCPTAEALRREADEQTIRRVQERQAPAEGEEASWAAASLGSGTCIEGVLCGSDGGLATAERLQHALVPLRSNGIVTARRDKFLMQEALRAADLHVASQERPALKNEASLESRPCIYAPKSCRRETGHGACRWLPAAGRRPRPSCSGSVLATTAHSARCSSLVAGRPLSASILSTAYKKRFAGAPIIPLFGLLLSGSWSRWPQL